MKTLSWKIQVPTGYFSLNVQSQNFPPFSKNYSLLYSWPSYTLEVKGAPHTRLQVKKPEPCFLCLKNKGIDKCLTSGQEAERVWTESGLKPQIFSFLPKLDVPGPEFKSKPKHRPQRLQWHRHILNPLHHKGTPIKPQVFLIPNNVISNPSSNLCYSRINHTSPPPVLWRYN